MRKRITTKNFETGAMVPLSFEPVKKCPLCHSAFNGETMESALAPYEFSQDGRKERELCLYVLHYCQVCSLGFLGIYSPEVDNYDELYKLVSAVPQKSEPLQFTAEIMELSQAFVNICEEAYIAEKSGLTLICGMGYRKALEFLVKDYLVSRFPQNADVIMQEPLG